MEDGREVFDDDLDDDNVNQAKGGGKGFGKKKTKGPTGKSGNIKNIFLNMPSKSKEVKIIDFMSICLHKDFSNTFDSFFFL